MTGIRDETNVPTQALQLLNDEFVVGRADALAYEILQFPRTDTQHVREVFRRTLGRDPTAAEQRSATAFMQDISRLHTKDSAFESLDSPDQQSLSRLRRLAPDATQEILDRSMREAGVTTGQADRVRQLLEAEELPRAVERSLNRLRRQGIERSDPRFPDRLRRLLDARDRLASLPSNVSSREYQVRASGLLDARTAAWSALAQALFASADFLYRP